MSRAALWPGLAIWTIALLRTPLPALGGSFVHLINLVFHEAGHIVFAPLGSFIWEAILAALGCFISTTRLPALCGRLAQP